MSTCCVFKHRVHSDWSHRVLCSEERDVRNTTDASHTRSWRSIWTSLLCRYARIQYTISLCHSSLTRAVYQRLRGEFSNYKTVYKCPVFLFNKIALKFIALLRRALPTRQPHDALNNVPRLSVVHPFICHPLSPSVCLYSSVLSSVHDSEL